MRGAPSTTLRVNSGDDAISFADTDCFAPLLRNKIPRPVSRPLDASLRWHDDDHMPVIPGEHRETRNPGAPRFCLYAERLRYGALRMTILKERVVKCPTVMGFDLVALVDSGSGSAG